MVHFAPGSLLIKPGNNILIIKVIKGLHMTRSVTIEHHCGPLL